MSSWTGVAAIVATFAVIAVFASDGAEAKRGCATFGHSCYGAMGKRTNEIVDGNLEEVLQNDQDQEENPAFVFTGPRSGFKRSQKLSPKQYDELSRVIRQWIQSYQRKDDPGYNVL